MSYSSEQIEHFAQLAFDVMTTAMIADRTGPVSALRELMAGGRFLAEAKEKYADHPFIPALIQNLSLQRTEEDSSGEPPAIEMSHREQAYLALEEKIAVAVAQLVDDEDIRRFKQFLVELAEAVVQASGAGLFGSGEKVTLEERSFIERLQALLGVQQD